MKAADARAITLKRQSEITAANKILYGEQQRKLEDAYEQRVKDQVRFWKSQIEEAAKKGESHLDDGGYPHDDQYNRIFNAAKALLQADGFRIHEYTTDEGYCIGDVSHVSISW